MGRGAVQPTRHALPSPTTHSNTHPEWGLTAEDALTSQGQYDEDISKLRRCGMRNYFFISGKLCHYKSLSKTRKIILFSFCLISAGVALLCFGEFQRVQYSEYLTTVPELSEGTGKVNLSESLIVVAPPEHVYSLPYPSHMFEVEFTIHVFIPLFNEADFVLESVESVLRQTHSRLHVWVYDDGSTDDTSAILHMKFGMDKRVNILQNSLNLGPAQTKWIGFQAIAQEALPNDIILLLDGDDYLVSDDALARVHAEYVKAKCWFTYGSYIGPFSHEVRELDADTGQNFRMAAWRYGHPRTFKAFLINYLSDADFKQADGSWLTKGTDRGFVFRFLELSGSSRISYIRSEIYFYRKHTSNRWSLVSKESKAAQLAHISNIPSFTALEEDIHVFIETSGNAHVLHDFIKSVAMFQTLSYRIKLHVWNNKNSNRKQIDATILNFPSLKIDVLHSTIDFHSFGCFIHIKKALQKEAIDYVIIADENLMISDDYVEKLWEERKPQTLISWFGKHFTENFFSRVVPSNLELVQGLRTDISQFHISGLHGCIIDSNVFLMPAALIIPQQYSTFEDIWISYVLYKSRWSITRTFVRPLSSPEYIASRDLSRSQAQREEFLSYLHAGGWHV